MKLKFDTKNFNPKTLRDYRNMLKNYRRILPDNYKEIDDLIAIMADRKDAK